MPDIIILGAMIKDNDAQQAPTGCMSFFRPKPAKDSFMEGFRPGVAYNELYRCSSGSKTWRKDMELQMTRQYYGVATIGSLLFIVGGCDMLKGRSKLVPQASVLRVDISSNSWCEVHRMATPRMRHAVCAVGTILFAIGGLDSDMKALNTVERYDLGFNLWRPVCPLRRARFAAAATLHQGRIWVAGGRTRSDVTTDVIGTVECYDVRDDTWTLMAHLRVPRCHANLFSCEGRLYVGGGAGVTSTEGEVRLTSLPSLDVLEAGKWHHVGDMSVPRHSAAAFVANGKLYFLGGITTNNNRGLGSVECFDTTSGQFVNLSDVPWLPYPCRWLRGMALAQARHADSEKEELERALGVSASVGSVTQAKLSSSF